MPNYLNYQQSISNELLSIKDRVRYFIDGRHWGQDGRYKEIILSNVLRHHLPKGVSVGTGFVINEAQITRQIDIIVYRDDCPLLFRQDDFIIAPAECVLGIIEVKSLVNKDIAKDAVHFAAENGRIIGRGIFNGVFAFENEKINDEDDKIAHVLLDGAGFVNNICFGKDMFIKYWDAGMPLQNPCARNSYAVYRIQNLAFGYFISNLVEDVYIALHGGQIPDTLQRMFYPIEGTKETYRKLTINVQGVRMDGEF